MFRGILSTIYVDAKKGVSLRKIQGVLVNHYKAHKFVKISKTNTFLRLQIAAPRDGDRGRKRLFLLKGIPCRNVQRSHGTCVASLFEGPYPSFCLRGLAIFKAVREITIKGTCLFYF